MQQWQPFFSTRAQRIALARERFFASGEHIAGLVDPLIAQSWARSIDFGHRPERPPAFDAISRSRMQSALERSQALLRAAAPELDQLDSLLAGTPCKAVLTDDQCVVIRSTPQAAGAGGLLDTAARQGVSVHEKLVASSASAICVAAGATVNVDGAEHFFDALRHFYCAAAPIRDAAGMLVGSLDLSREGEAFRFDAMAVARQFAAAIERRLFLQGTAGRVLLRFQVCAQFLHTPLEGLAAVDEAGSIDYVNQAGRSLLLSAAEDLDDADAEAVFGLTNTQLLQRLGTGEPRLHRLPNGLQVWLLVDVCPGVPGNVRRVAAPTLSSTSPSSGSASALRGLSRQVIAETLANCGGNISATARALHVSRGLLYRHLREAAPLPPDEARGCASSSFRSASPAGDAVCAHPTGSSPQPGSHALV